MIIIEKHLKATRIDTSLENTIVVDIDGLSEPIRVIGIYWLQGQVRNLNDLCPFLVRGTVLTGDFNASVEEWGSKSTDSRGARLKKWIEENDLAFSHTTSGSSKRSNRHIDLAFTNLSRVPSETLFYGTSDHWPTLSSSTSVGLTTSGFSFILIGPPIKPSVSFWEIFGRGNKRSNPMINGTKVISGF